MTLKVGFVQSRDQDGPVEGNYFRLEFLTWH